MAAKKPRTQKKKPEPEARGLTAAEAGGGKPPPAVAKLAEQVAADAGTVVGTYRDPLGGNWQLIAVLPIDKVEPTPFQRDLSATHVKRLAQRIDELGRFLDPVVVVRRDDGTYWTPNGNHRLHALRELGARAITALLVPEQSLAYQILSLNTEKAHNLREKALEVIRMARDLAGTAPGDEQDHALVFEDPELLTLGVCYEKNGRFSGGVYRPVLRRLESFLDQKLGKALAERERRAELLLALDAAVVEAVQRLQKQGLTSPYLKNFVVSRLDPDRFKRAAAAKGKSKGKGAAKAEASPPKADFAATLGKLTQAAAQFDASKVKAAQLAAAGGASSSEE
ncbi:MAG TPA: ParB N-terminal domain-containing protein [Planctomycetota bacterium]